MNWMPAVVFLCVCVAIALVRVGIGPTVPDRAVGLDTVNTIVVTSMVLLGAAFNEALYIDVAIVYALLSFVTTLFIARYIEKGKF
ncbi:MAG: cation:proton antiporter [Dehalococcoidia bacterium]|jgi:multicomponent Na+:H+ antiporter subunit F|nr:cation:proton antiporter [Dehalococcoidia bacterium]